MSKKNGKTVTQIIYGSKPYDYDDDALSIYGVDKNSKVDKSMEKFHNDLDKDLQEILKKAPKRK